MNYKKLYNSIIENRKQTPSDAEYTEVHHIVPRSLGGSDDEDNLVRLSAREHFICHYLLSKLYPKESLEWYKINHAFLMMKCDSYNQSRYYNSRLYEALKGNFSSVMRYAQSGTKNSQYGTTWISFLQLNITKKCNFEELPLYIDQGWIQGRSLWKKIEKLNHNVNIKKEKKYKKNLEHQKYIDDLNKLHDVYISKGFDAVKNLGYQYSQANLVMAFKRHLKHFKSQQGRGRV